MKTISKILSAAFVLMFANHSFAQSTGASATANASANIVAPITITKVTDLQFGTVAVNGANGTVVLGHSDDRTPGGGVTLPATTTTVKSAEFTVGGDGNRAFIIELPVSTTLSNGAGGNMTVNTFTSSLGASSNLASNTATLKVGATLNVSGGQAAGTYTGTFSVRVDYQ